MFYSPSLVFFSRHRLKVVWIAAGSLAAKMIYRHSFGNVPSKQLIRSSMNVELTAQSGIHSSPVASVVKLPLPNPTFCRVSAILNRYALRDILKRTLCSGRAGALEASG